MTDTAIDAYTAVYLALHKAGVGASDADVMDLTFVAALLGVGGRQSDWERWRAEMIEGRRRAEATGDTWTWGDPTG